MKNIGISLVFILLSKSALSSSSDSAYNNSILDFNIYMQLVLKHHPNSMIANLELDKGNYTVLKAKGNFDPNLFADGGQKYFDGDQYYSLLNGGVSIPTWFGIEINAGYATTDGYYLNPQNNLPPTGLVYAGISVPLGKDLFIDKRRAELKKANLYQSFTQFQRINMQNELLVNAGMAYWNWFWAYHEFAVYSSAYVISQERFKAIKSTAEFGDRPDVDTLEAFIQVQNRWIQMSQAEVSLVEKTNELNVFLWIEGKIPVELNLQKTTPPNFTNLILPTANEILPQTLDSILDKHPELSAYDLKLNMIGVQEQYYREQLKPKIDLKYNAINQPINVNPFADYSSENYTWGVDISFPIFLREERANLKLIQIDEMELTYDINVKRQQLKQKTQFYNFELIATHEQYQQYVKTIGNYNDLVEAEKKLFEIGESSLFMINMRENNYFQAQLKLLEIIYKNQKAHLMFYFIIGNLYEKI